MTKRGEIERVATGVYRLRRDDGGGTPAGTRVQTSGPAEVHTSRPVSEGEGLFNAPPSQMEGARREAHVAGS
jgi:hypothetical protein